MAFANKSTSVGMYGKRRNTKQFVGNSGRWKTETVPKDARRESVMEKLRIKIHISNYTEEWLAYKFKPVFHYADLLFDWSDS